MPQRKRRGATHRGMHLAREASVRSGSMFHRPEARSEQARTNTKTRCLQILARTLGTLLLLGINMAFGCSIQAIGQMMNFLGSLSGDTLSQAMARRAILSSGLGAAAPTHTHSCCATRRTT